MVLVTVEYCGICNFESQCKELEHFLKNSVGDVEVKCVQGRRGSFEVTIDGQLVHSKLNCLAFPDHNSVLENVQRVKNGLNFIKVKEQPINNCVIM